jgi:hypothetical protein
MSRTVIQVEGLVKRYRIGQVAQTDRARNEKLQNELSKIIEPKGSVTAVGQLHLHRLIVRLSLL